MFKLNSTIDTLTNNGVDGTEKGALARDVVVSGIKRNIRSLVTDALPGFEDNPRYISELGIRTERDGSLSLTEEDFKENFSREPILFDVMVNSLARTNNPLVTASHTSDILQPKGYLQLFRKFSRWGNASLNGVAEWRSIKWNSRLCSRYRDTGLRLQRRTNATV